MTMAAPGKTILIMAAGTGGHVFPALAIARHLQRLGANIEWLGTRSGMENELLADAGMNIHHISIGGLKGAGIKRKLLAPFMLITALLQSIRILNAVQPDCVLGMGGFVCGPGGVAARLKGTPLVIHEQNAVAGLTNRLLANLASCVLEAFPATFPEKSNVIHTGNPLRSEIAELNRQPRTSPDQERVLRILILGGSQGAAAINQVLPAVWPRWDRARLPEIWHQTGHKALAETQALYAGIGLQNSPHCKIVPFITDMAAAYHWADLVICRSGASTVSELAAVGLPSILVPYPFHSDQQQLHNANWLVNVSAAHLMEQATLTADNLLVLLQRLDNNRAELTQMGAAARALATCNAGEVIASICMEYANA